MAKAAKQETGEEEFPDTPEGQARRWGVELDAATKELEEWHKQAKSIIARFRDDREGEDKEKTRWNLFSANVITQRAMVLGNAPKVSVERRFADANDDVARVAAEELDRLLNCDIERDGDSYAVALGYATSDRLLPGLGQARVRYVVEMGKSEPTEAITHPETGEELAAAIEPQDVKASEDVETDYVNWKDFLWSPGAEVWHLVRWVAFRVEMSRKELRRRFGDEGGKVPLAAKKGGGDDKKKSGPLDRAEVWEIWDKDERRVHFYVKGHPVILESRPDPLELDGFFPCPRPLIANATTDRLIPVPDYKLAQDLYLEINEISSRVALLIQAVRVAGAYDKGSAALERLLDGKSSNMLIPVSNWAMFAEKGGIKGIIDWLPLDQVVQAIIALRDYRRELKDALYEITGMSDIMRGSASDTGVTATEQSIKAKFGSVRIQALQDEVARFATDLQRLKSEIIAKHFDVQTILERSNAQYGFDQVMAQQAAELIKSDIAQYRIEVKPEAISLTDFAALKAERMEVLGMISGYMQAVAPIAQQNPSTAPFLLEMLQWCVAGLRGSSGIEGVLDQAIAAAKQQAAQPAPPAPPDPKIAALQLKAQVDTQKGQQDLQNDMIRTQVEVRAEEQKQAIQTRYNVQEQAQKDQLKAASQAQILSMQPPRGVRR